MKNNSSLCCRFAAINLPTYHILKFTNSYRETIVLAIPVIIGQLSNLLMNITDNIIVGHLGPDALSAASFANSCFYLVAVFGFGAMNAIPSLVAEARGAENEENVRQHLWAGLGSGLITGTLIGVILFAISYWMPYMGQPENDVLLAMPFLQLMALSAPFMIMFSSIKGFFDGLEKSSIGMIISTFGLALNIFLNLGLIFGQFGMPEIGFIGSAFSTLISRVVVFILMLVTLFLHPVSKPYLNTKKLDLSFLLQNLKLGIPMGLQILFEVAAFSGAGIMIGWLPGDEAIVGRSAHQIALNMVSATYMVMLGLSVAGSIKVGEAYGSGNPVAIKKAGEITIKLALAVVVISATCLFFFSGFFSRIYGIEDYRVVLVTASLVQIAAIFQIFDGIQCISAGLLRGIQDVKVPTIITFAAYWVIWIPLAYWMGFTLDMGVEGIWYADLIALGIAAVLLSWRFFSSAKLKIRYYE